MLINLKYLCSKYGFIPNGVLHVGAHAGEELSSYDEVGVKNVIWIEANPVLSGDLHKKLQSRAGQKVLNFLVSDVNDCEFDFKITNNGESSSILDMETHLKHHPHINVVKTIKLKSKRLDFILNTEEVKGSDYDFINIDIQGAELMALKGLGDKINDFKYIYTEINVGEVYKGCAKMNEIDDYLTKYGFKRVDTKLTDYEWGDAFYIKEK